MKADSMAESTRRKRARAVERANRETRLRRRAERRAAAAQATDALAASVVNGLTWLTDRTGKIVLFGLKVGFASFIFWGVHWWIIGAALSTT